LNGRESPIFGKTFGVFIPLRPVYDYLQKERACQLIQLALVEDVGRGDFTSLACIPADIENKANLLVKDIGVLAGIEAARWVCEVVDKNISFEQYSEEGSRIKPGDIAFSIRGNSRSILKAERLLLNIMQRMSGIATYTYSLVEKIAHTNARLLDTRKTTPNFRLFEKWAVKIGGGHNHRYGLFDMILLKDNHIDVAGGIENALLETRRFLQESGREIEVEIEVRNLEELKQVLQIGGVKRVMFDNMTPEILKIGVKMVDGKIETEVSGGVNEDTIVALAETGVDFISVGKLTHSVKSLDLSLKAI
jgi:nicotinate-nucleotide pyrophosphorylase (carboxylating)